MRFPVADVTEGVVPNSDHWIFEEHPDAIVTIVTDFLEHWVPDVRLTL
jgi:hypothetical protein